jgi:hypothetical protein
MNKYPMLVKAVDVVNGDFDTGLFKLKNGKVAYDQVYMHDGGNALYLVRINSDLSTVMRWIPWDTELLKMFPSESDLSQ